MRSYVVKRFLHFRHSRRRRMESASLLSRESTTLSFANPQKGHFMALGTHCIVAGENVVTAAGLSSATRAWLLLRRDGSLETISAAIAARGATAAVRLESP